MHKPLMLWCKWQPCEVAGFLQPRNLRCQPMGNTCDVYYAHIAPNFIKGFCPKKILCHKTMFQPMFQSIEQVFVRFHALRFSDSFKLSSRYMNDVHWMYTMHFTPICHMGINDGYVTAQCSPSAIPSFTRVL